MVLHCEEINKIMDLICSYNRGRTCKEDSKGDLKATHHACIMALVFFRADKVGEGKEYENHHSSRHSSGSPS